MKLVLAFCCTLLLAPSTLAYLKVVGPVVRIFDSAADRLLRKAGIEPVEELHHGATLEDGRPISLQALESLLAAIQAGDVPVLSVRVQ